MEKYTLFELEKDYYLGNYQRCVNKANSMDADKEPLFYLCLSYYHLKKYDNLELELKKHSNFKCIELIGLLLAYTRNVNGRDAIIQQLDSMLDDKSVDAKDDLSRLVISSIYVRQKLYSNALRALNQLDTLPAYLARIGVYLQMNRLDFAERTLKSMQSKDDYATLTLLAVAQVRLAFGNAREAYDIGKELEDKYRPTPLLYNLQAAAAISMGQYDLGDRHCENSLEMDNDNLEALINRMHTLSKSNALSAAKERDSYLSRLMALYPEHEFVQEVNRMTVELTH